MAFRLVLALALASGASGCYRAHGAAPRGGVDGGTPIDRDATAPRECADEGAACDDGDPCTVFDVCSAGRCHGAPRRCDEPPGECFGPAGACVRGGCVYSVRVGAACDDGEPCTRGDACDPEGVCAGETLRCEEPPPPECVDGASLHEPRGPGRCEDGRCAYGAVERACPDGCVDGACRCVEAPWTGGVVDESADVGRYTDIVADASGALHVAYSQTASEGRLRYARRSPGRAWSVLTIDANGDVGGSPSIAVAPDGVVHVIYEDLGRGVLKHAERLPGGAWSRETVPGAGERWNGDLAIDADGTLHVAFTDGSEPSGTQLAVAHRPAGGAWTTERVGEQPDSGLFPSIAVDPSGAVHVVHLARLPGSLEYAHHDEADGWTTSTIDDTDVVGGGNAVTIDRLGTVHVAYFHPADDLLRHAERDRTGAWTLTSIPEGSDARWNVDIAVDGYGGLHVVHDRLTPDLQHTYRSPDGDWRSERVGTTGYSLSYLGGTAITVDRRGDLHVVHHDELERTLRHARRRFCP